jgi:cyanophycin synthetase
MRPSLHGVDREAWYAERWTAAAAEGGWTVTVDEPPFVDLARQGVVLRTMGSDLGIDSHVTYRTAGNKSETTRRLVDAGIATTSTSEFDVTDVRRVLRCVGGDATTVVKPAAGTGAGAGVTVGPRGTAMTLRAIRDSAAYSRRIAVEPLIEGRVVRVLVLHGRVLDAVHRAPAAVTGDGEHSIADLVARENERRATLGPLSTGFVGTGADHLAALARASTTRRSVPGEGEVVVVAGRSNTGSELESRRIALAPAAASVATRAADAVGVQLAGVDLVIDPDGAPAGVLEVNTGPGLHWHVLVEGEPFDPFAAILNELATTRTISG